MFHELQSVEQKVEALVAVCTKWFSGFGDRLNEEARAILSPPAEAGAPQPTGDYNPYAPIWPAGPAATAVQAPAAPAQADPVNVGESGTPAVVEAAPAPAREGGVTTFAPPDSMPPTGGAVETPQERLIAAQQAADAAAAALAAAQAEANQ